MKKTDQSWIDVDVPCWIPEQDSFLPGVIVSTNPLICKYQNHTIEQPKLIYQRNGVLEDLDDLIDMTILNEPELTNAISQRYENGKFQTYIGPTLLVVNPIILKGNLYTPEIRNTYRNNYTSRKLPPHIFGIANEALRECVNKPQTIIISGESGAGKTENAKLCMKFLAQFGSFENKILNCNPILESFGNAKTQRNNNSSRFGKLIKLYFDNDFKLQGASIVNYLLEKCRITQPNQGERNFHIFYQFLQGFDHLQLFNLQSNCELYEYLRKSGCYFQPKDQLNYQELIDAFKSLNFDSETIQIIIACILLLGNIEFEDTESGCKIKDYRIPQKICQLLGISEKEFIRNLTTKTRTFVKNEIIDTPLSRIECVNCQTTMARYLYDRLFTFLIEQLNTTLQPQQYTHQINILDIYGFEVFQVNNFEQLFINYTNEKLLQLYIQYVFKQEEKIFQNEGLQGFQTHVAFNDNQSIIDCLEKPPLGILNILDDSCAVAGTDETFLTRMKSSYSNSQIVLFTKIQQPTFRIRHTPREVEYNVIGFRIKNKDETNKQIQITLSKSKNQVISQIYSKSTKQDKYLGLQIRQEMAELMNMLKDSGVHFVRCVKPNEHLQNTQLSPSLILNQIRYLGVLETLSIRKNGYSVRKSYQQFYLEFGDMTNYTIYPLVIKSEFKPLVIKMIQQYFAFTDQEILFGFTLIFLKQSTINAIRAAYKQQMEEKRVAAKKLQNAWICFRNAMIFKGFLYRVRMIQAHIKGFLTRIKFRLLIQSVVTIQRHIRQFLSRVVFLKYKRAAKTIQTYLKRVYAIKYVIVEKEAVLKIQQYMKQILRKRRLRRYLQSKSIVDQVFNKSWRVILWRSATKIQKVWRGYFIRNMYEEQVSQIKLAGFLQLADRAVIVIQRHARGYIARNFYQQLRGATLYIQGYFRTKWLRDLFVRIRIAAIQIQKFVRNYQRRTRMDKLFELQVIKPMENDLLRLRELEFKNLHDDYIEQVIEHQQENQNNPKIDLFAQIVDLEILADVSEIYDSLWTNLYKKCFKDAYERNNYLQNYCIGECHAYATSLSGKIYAWGLNDECQQGDVKINSSKINLVQFPHKVKVLKSGANHGCFLTNDQILFCTDSKQPILKDVKQFCVYNDEMIAVDDQNILYTWNRKHSKPTECKNWTAFLKMSQLTQKMGVNQISMGLGYFILLTSNGLMLSMGDNSQGELGIGNRMKRNELCLIELQDKISEVHCGMKHTIAKSTLGKVYTWGWGQHGQLGIGETEDQLLPRQVILETKAIQVMGGHKQSVVLLDNRRVYWFGSNSCLQYQDKPVELMTNQQVVRIVCEWSRTISIVYVTFANYRKILENNAKLRHKILSSLTQKWCENDIYSIDPPYCESLANYFTSMKKPLPKTNIKFASKIEHQQLVKQLQQSNNNIVLESGFFSFKDESNILKQRDLQRDVEEQYKQVGTNQQVKDLKQKVKSIDKSNESEEKLKQLRDIKKRYEIIQQKNQLEYTDLDKQFLEIVKSSDLEDLLQFIV